MLPAMRKVDRCVAIIVGNPGLTVKGIAEALSEEKAPTSSDVESVRITLKRERDQKDKARVYCDAEGRWFPLGKLTTVERPTLHVVREPVKPGEGLHDLPF
jgi:hypothetical protein